MNVFLRRTVRSFIAPAVLIVAVIYLITPLYFMLQISFGNPESILTQHPPLLIKDITFQHWIDIFKSGSLLAPLVKSLVVATIAMIGTLIITVPAAYEIAKLPRALSYSIVIALLISRMIPEVSIALPISITFIKMHLMDTYIGLALAHMIRTLPLVTWILVGTFRSIPKELEESAMIDGCTRWSTLRHVILPLAAPGIAVGCIFAWLESWNEFLYALYLTLLKPTMPIQILYYVQRGSWFNSAAYTILLVVPVLVVVMLFQRRIRTEYLTVGLKG